MNSTLPPLRQGPTTWYGPSLEKQTDQWVFQLSKLQIQELESAAGYFRATKKTIGQMTQKDFPLPRLRAKLAAFQQQLIKGIGFGLIKGLPIHQYTEEEMISIFYGIGTYLGQARSQNAQGHVLGQVRNLGLDSRDPKVRLYQTNERQTFHTDSCDVVGLLCVQPAKAGGRSLLVSADTVFNRMHQNRPDLLTLLLQPIATDRRGEVPAGMDPYLLIPVFSYFAGLVTPFYQRQYIESAQRFPQAPRLSPKHFEALDYFDKLCNDPELHLSMLLEKGDLQFVYNHAMLHDRTGFIDYPQVAKRRHLARLWLSVPGDRPLPDIFASRFGSVEIGNRGGILVPGTQLSVPWMKDLLA